MRFADIPVGSIVLFGRKNGYFNDPIPWTKVSEEFLLARNSVAYSSFSDYGVSDNFYLTSRIHRWLNMDYGFLSLFSEEERNMLQPFVIKVSVPKHLRKTQGKIQAAQCFASLPAISQLLQFPERHNTVQDEGESWKIADVLRQSAVTRSFCGMKSYFKYTYRGGTVRLNPQTPHPLNPIIKIDPNAHFAPDAAGRFVISEPTFTFSDETLLSFITMC